jgi:hypothetical protein
MCQMQPFSIHIDNRCTDVGSITHIHLLLVNQMRFGRETSTICGTPIILANPQRFKDSVRRGEHHEIIRHIHMRIIIGPTGENLSPVTNKGGSNHV